MSEIKEVYWKRGYRNKIKAKTAYEELKKIEEKNGGVLTAGIVALAAKPVRHPLHKEIYKLDLQEAAHEFYLNEARRLIRSIEVVYKDTPHIPPTREYVKVTEAPKGGNPARSVYLNMEESLRDPIKRDEVLGNAIREAISYRRKYAALSELAEVFIAIDHVIDKGNLA